MNVKLDVDDKYCIDMMAAFHPKFNSNGVVVDFKKYGINDISIKDIDGNIRFADVFASKFHKNDKINVQFSFIIPTNNVSANSISIPDKFSHILKEEIIRKNIYKIKRDMIEFDIELDGCNKITNVIKYFNMTKKEGNELRKAIKDKLSYSCYLHHLCYINDNHIYTTFDCSEENIINISWSDYDSSFNIEIKDI